jgi:hypothetical protein
MREVLKIARPMVTLDKTKILKDVLKISTDGLPYIFEELWVADIDLTQLVKEGHHLAVALIMLL